MNDFDFPLNEDELFYKNYHAAAQSAQTLQDFLKSVNKKDALRRRLIISEFFQEQIYNEETPEKIIAVKRYNRYTPAIVHRHSHFEIPCVFGKCVFNVGFDSLHLAAGDMIILPPETLHTVEAFNDDAIIFAINLHGKSPIKYLLFHTAGDEFFRENVLCMANDENRADKYTETFLIGKLILGFVRIMRRHRENFEMSELQPTNFPDNFLLINYIQENLSTVTPEDVAREFNFSVSHCSRLIKAATGLNFNEWRKILRLKRAEYLLTNTNQSVDEISSAIGYLNAENFIRSFQKEFGTTPAKYRKTNRT